MPSPGVGQAVVAKHPDIATQSSSPHAVEGRVSPQEASASSKGSSRLRGSLSSASSSSRSQSEGGQNSRARAAVRLSQLERLKAHRQSAQAGRAAAQKLPGAAAPERPLPGYPAGRPGNRPSGPGSGRSPSGVAGARQRSSSKGYLDRYAAACAASGKTANPLQPQGTDAQQSVERQEQMSAHGEESTRSRGTVRLSSAESRTGTSGLAKHPQEAMTAAHYNLAEPGQEGTASCVLQCSTDTAPQSSHASVASQQAPSGDDHGRASEPGAIDQFSHDEQSARMDAAHDQAAGPGLAQAELEQLPRECPQAPGRAKPLPQAEPPVCSPQTHPEGSQASSASPARLRSPLPAAAGPAGSAGVLFVQPPPEIEVVQKILGTVGALKDAGQQAPPAQAAASNLQRLVNLHVYAATGPTRRGEAAQQPRSAASVPDLGPANGASLDKMRSPLTSVEEGPASQFWEVQKRVGEVPATPAQGRPRGLPSFLAGLCGCFAPQPHTGSSESVVVNLCMTSGMPGNGEILPTVLDCSEAIPEEHSSILDSQSDMEAHPPTTDTAASTEAAGLRTERSLPAAPTEGRPSLPRAVPDQGSLPAVPMEKQPSLPRAAQEQVSHPAGVQKQGSTPAGLHQQQQQLGSDAPEPEGANTWLPPPDQELVPFVSSTMALFNHALPAGSGQADAASQESAGSDRSEPAALIVEDSTEAEERQAQATAEGSATLQTQTSLAELLQSEGESSAHTAPVQRTTKKPAQGGKEDVTKWFLPGSGKKNSLKAFLERQHPDMPSALLDPKAPAPWRSSPARSAKPSSAKKAPAPPAATSAGPRAGDPPRQSVTPQGEESPLHVPVYQRQSSPALAALAKNRAPKETTAWKQTQAWSPAKTNIAIVKGTSKHPTGAAISIACTAAPGQAAELAGQRTAAADMSASAQPVSCQDTQPPKQATPAGKRAVHATINQLHEVSQTKRTSLKPPQSTATTAHRQSAVPAQPAVERPGRVPGTRSAAVGADAAKRRRPVGRAMPGQQMPHLQAAMLGPGLRTNALLESGGSMGSVQSMQASRIAMQSIGEAKRVASRDRSRSAASTRALSGTRGSGVTALERRVLQQYLSARQLRDKTAAERGVPSPNQRYKSAQPTPQQQGVDASNAVLPERSSRASTGLSASLEAELRDLERHWEDLDRADAQHAVQAQTAAHATDGYYEDEELLAQKKVASVIERWESRSISADALQHMRERASAYSGHRGSSADDSVTDEVSIPQGSKEGQDEGLTFATLDMLEQLSSPAEKLAAPGAQEGTEQHPEHSSKVSTDMESICEARTLPDSHSPLSSATSSLSQRGAAARSAEKLPFASDSGLMAAVTAAAAPSASLPQAAALTSGLKPQKLADAFSTAADESLTGDPKIESLSSSERSLIAAHLGTAGSNAVQLSST